MWPVVWDPSSYGVRPADGVNPCLVIIRFLLLNMRSNTGTRASQ